MVRVRKLALALTGLAAVVALAIAVAAPAAAPAAPAKQGRVILSPKPGQLVRANTTRVAIRARGWARVRLNGHELGAELRRGRRGVRQFKASISQGLRQGRNVLTVTVKRG